MTNNPHNTPDPRVVYADIIGLPHWESPTRPRMSLYNRAAQFSPFAALSGYEDIINEEASETSAWIEPGESRKEQINRQLNLIAEAAAAKQKPLICITHFIPDAKKSGGAYATAEGFVRKIDPVRQTLLLTNTETGREQEIGFGRITDISLKPF